LDTPLYMYGEVELRFLSFLTLALGKGEWLVLRSGRFTAETETATSIE
jgi:hypothetical protein